MKTIEKIKGYGIWVFWVVIASLVLYGQTCNAQTDTVSVEEWLLPIDSMTYDEDGVLWLQRSGEVHIIYHSDEAISQILCCFARSWDDLGPCDCRSQKVHVTVRHGRTEGFVILELLVNECNSSGTCQH